MLTRQDLENRRNDFPINSKCKIIDVINAGIKEVFPEHHNESGEYIIAECEIIHGTSFSKPDIKIHIKKSPNSEAFYYTHPIYLTMEKESCSHGNSVD